MAVVPTTTTAIQDEPGLVRKHIKRGDELALEFRGRAYARIVPADQYAEIVERAERAAELEARLAELEAQHEAVPA
ncbi:antitoxin (DNA-binding transcriptional repressor) of toxin-antitoxin stability system [Prauserella isguenensis]|uniref:Antitoxin (DNA-binding transcriptional repressor) of toxin-antitoxin stability system n=1 Tax=Prauserella isguenensis TaxID=1470180 RepID=A0A839S953_9PSEU|nr:hypothetical protein [Prauserella isguenensis]MBB3053520.1 antitoxin (DNA-binding transcriptional repressor) of toxin-antitoxin stability system [Prauserella isguenensis]